MMSFYTVCLSLFFIMNPFGDLATFIALLSPFSFKQQIYIVLRESLIGIVVLSIFVFFGNKVLGIIGVDTTTVELAGGIILFLMALGMIFPKDKADSKQKIKPFIVPLAIPIIAGPALMATLVIYSHKMDNDLLLFAALFLCWGLSTLIYASSSFVKKILGEHGTKAVTRLGGIILSMISIQMLSEGFIKVLKEAIK